MGINKFNAGPIEIIAGLIDFDAVQIKNEHTHIRPCRRLKRQKAIRLHTRKTNRHHRGPNGPLFYEETLWPKPKPSA